jgi:hypothetical protein
MRSIIFFLLVVGAFMVMHGIYEQKYKALEQNRRVEYKFLPRTYYEEQIAEADVASKFKTMFDKESPWFERTVTLPKPNKKDS